MINFFPYNILFPHMNETSATQHLLNILVHIIKDWYHNIKLPKIKTNLEGLKLVKIFRVIP